MRCYEVPKLENGILNELDTACSGNAPATNTAEEHPVRCCKDSSVDLSSSGWTRGQTNFTPTDPTCTNVWARSQDADGIVIVRLTFGKQEQCVQTLEDVSVQVKSY